METNATDGPNPGVKSQSWPHHSRPAWDLKKQLQLKVKFNSATEKSIGHNDNKVTCTLLPRWVNRFSQWPYVIKSDCCLHVGWLGNDHNSCLGHYLDNCEKNSHFKIWLFIYSCSVRPVFWFASNKLAHRTDANNCTRNHNKLILLWLQVFTQLISITTVLHIHKKKKQF